MNSNWNWREFYNRGPVYVGWLIVGLLGYIFYLLWLYGFSAQWHDSHATLCDASQSYLKSLEDVEFTAGDASKRQEIKRIEHALASSCAEL